MKIVITGGKGMLASNIIPTFQKHHSVVTVDIDEWDITNREKGAVFIGEHKPDVIINLAAITNVDGCEDIPEIAQKVNGDAPGILAELCEANHVKLVHFSTDYVFDGTKDTPYNEEDIPNPQSVYGKSKMSAEIQIKRYNPSAIIMRAEWLYGGALGGGDFITKITKAAREKGHVEVVDDQRGTPTYAKDIGEPLMSLIENDRSGIYHISNSGSTTWYGFTKEIFRLLDLDVPLTPTTSDAYKTKAKRPKNSVYDLSKLHRDTGITMRPWHEALRDYLLKK
ncbi:MAG TPA: dTDP-4-dehydrorhamnose reductase [Syntrophorhabdaceae bacterium]|nr:dTDP-4-dehydrorhamnose reductase [Syntrophorhabdaceae bacterium]